MYKPFQVEIRVLSVSYKRKTEELPAENTQVFNKGRNTWRCNNQADYNLQTNNCLSFWDRGSKVNLYNLNFQFFQELIQRTVPHMMGRILRTGCLWEYLKLRGMWCDVMVEKIASIFETSIIVFKTTRNNQEESNLRNLRRENLKSPFKIFTKYVSIIWKAVQNGGRVRVPIRRSEAKTFALFTTILFFCKMKYGLKFLCSKFQTTLSVIVHSMCIKTTWANKAIICSCLPVLHTVH